MNKLLGFLLLALCGLAQAQINNVTVVTQGSPDGTTFVTKVLQPPASPGLYYLDTATMNPSFVTLGTGLSVTSGVLSGSFSQVNADWNSVSGASQILNKPTIPSAFNYGDPSARTLSVSTSYQANDPTKAAVITVSPTCTNSTTVLAASACTLQVRQHTSAVNCSTGTVTATWTSQYALGLLLTNTSGSPFDIKLGIGRFFILCPTTGTFNITTAVDQSAG